MKEVCGYSSKVTTVHENHIQIEKRSKKKACTDARLKRSLCKLKNVICQIDRVISRSIFQISFRAGGPWENQKIKEKCMWLFWKKLNRSFTFYKRFFSKWRRKCLAQRSLVFAFNNFLLLLFLWEKSKQKNHRCCIVNRS